MGEYAKYKGQSVKIGTCEDMYYLRADQAHLVTPDGGSLDPVAEADSIRFRFPFPEEDGIAPGEFDDHNYGVTVYGATVPVDVEHYTVQFSAPNGYLVSLPCPESGDYNGYGVYVKDGVVGGYKVHRNGYGGAVKISQQRKVGDQLVLICQCKGCGVAYRCPTFADCSSVMESLCESAAAKMRDYERNDTPGDLDIAKRYLEIGRRIQAGYEHGAADVIRARFSTLP